jgi:FkbM family methyltransferase
MYIMKIFYGCTDNRMDVTEVCMTTLLEDGFVIIPDTESSRSFYFTDTVPNRLKSIFVEIDGVETVFPSTSGVVINTRTNAFEMDHVSKLHELHKTLKLNHGSFREEYPEQKMSVRFLKGHEQVLELGGNIGRNSLIIASCLNDPSNLVTLECDENISKQLIENRDLNGLPFHIEVSALSKRKLIQHHWNTIPSDVLLPGYKWVSSITFEELQEKYNKVFDTLVLDCEGAFYYILQDMPEMLTNVKTIIMENDYNDLSQKTYIDETLKSNGFERKYFEKGGWGVCYEFFFEVWKKD